MANYVVTDQSITSVANAIRTKGGTSDILHWPNEFVSAIQSIPTGGGGGSTDGDVIFIDYDGSVVTAKTKAEINAMTADSELPPNPSHTGLIAQGWNWTVAQLKAQLLAMHEQKVYVGQMYTTASGATEIDVEMQEGRLEPILTICVDGTVSVDWGDNTTPDSVTGTSTSSRIAVSHTYASTGSYTIKIKESTGSSYAFYGSNQYALLRKDTTQNNNYVYSSTIKRIRTSPALTLKDQALRNCIALESITIPSSVTSIGNRVFYNCYSLKSITIPNEYTTISGLYGCISIKKMSFPGSATTIYSSAFYNCNSLGEFVIPNGVTNIGDSAFYNNFSLVKVLLPSSLTNIDANAFCYCYSLANITIPSGVTSIGSSAFGYCQGMKEYHFQRTAPPTLGTSAFSSIPSDCIIYVPYSADHSVLNAYKTETNWSTYASYMQEEPAP